MSSPRSLLLTFLHISLVVLLSSSYTTGKKGSIHFVDSVGLRCLLGDILGYTGDKYLATSPSKYRIRNVRIIRPNFQNRDYGSNKQVMHSRHDTLQRLPEEHMSLHYRYPTHRDDNITPDFESDLRDIRDIYRHRDDYIHSSEYMGSSPIDVSSSAPNKQYNMRSIPSSYLDWFSPNGLYRYKSSTEHFENQNSSPEYKSYQSNTQNHHINPRKESTIGTHTSAEYFHEPDPYNYDRSDAKEYFPTSPLSDLEKDIDYELNGPDGDVLRERLRRHLFNHIWERSDVDLNRS